MKHKTFSEMKQANFTFRTLALAAAIAVGATACGDNKKDNPGPEKPEPEEVKLPAPSTADFAKLRQEVLEGLATTSKHTVDLGGINFETKKKVKGLVESYALTKKDGTPVATGSEVEFTVAEIYDRGTMVVANMPLMGKNDAGKLEPLVTGGLLFLGAKQDGEELSYGSNFHFNVFGMELSFTGADLGNNMSNLWRGVTEAGSGNLTWTTNPPDGASRVGEAMPMGTEYNIEANVLGWLNVGWFYAHDGAKTNIKVSVPDGYDGKNAAVYLAYEGETNLLAQLVAYDSKDRAFSAQDGFVPVGKNVHVIFTSESEGKFVYAIKTANIKANDAIAFEHKDLATISKDDLVKKVNALK